MTDEAAFLRAVLDHPFDDGPRLVYADWLDERGDYDRAEFIRVQIELAAVGRAIEAVRQKIRDGRRGLAAPEHLLLKTERLHRRERELWGSWPDGDDLRSRFHAALPALEPTGWCILPGSMASDAVVPSALVRRGFVEAIACPLADWLAHGPALVVACPVTTVRLNDLEPANRTAVNGMWYWFRNGRNALGDWADESHVPDDLFDRLAGGAEDTIGLPFPSRLAAHAALSDADLTWAKLRRPAEARR